MTDETAARPPATPDELLARLKELGIETASGPRMARCVNVLNNTSWEVTERTYPFARAPAGGNSARSTIAHAGAPAVGRARNRQD